MTLVKAMATVGGMTLVSRVTGFARDLITANTLGAGPIADAFFVALKLPNFFRSITAEGAFSISFVPQYTKLRTDAGETMAAQFAARALTIMIACLLPFSILMMWFMPTVMLVLAPGFRDTPETFQMAVEMARLSFPYLLLVTIAAILGAILNAHHKFAPYAAAPVLFNLCLIGSIYLVTPFTETQGHAMAIGMSLSGVLQAIWVWVFIRRMGIHLTPQWPTLTPDMRTLFRRMGPGILVAGAFQINLFANLTIASFLPQGAISYLYYADRLYQLPFGVIGIAVGTALLPLFAQALAQKNIGQINDLYNRSIEYMLILCLPCAAALLLAADPVVRVLYQHGEFNAADAQATILVLMAYALGLPAYVITRVYNAVFYAHGDTWSPVKITLLTTGVNVVLSIILAYVLGAMGIAMSTALVGWASLYLLHRAVGKREMALTFDAHLIRTLPRILISVAFLAMSLIGLRYGLSGSIQAHAFMRSLGLVALVAISSLVYLTAIFLTQTISLADTRRYFTRSRTRAQHDDISI